MTDQHNPIPVATNAEPGKSMGTRQAFREIRKGIVVMWWAFFDWLAVVQWKALLLVSFIGMIIGGGILKLPTLTFIVILSALSSRSSGSQVCVST